MYQSDGGQSERGRFGSSLRGSVLQPLLWRSSWTLEQFVGETRTNVKPGFLGKRLRGGTLGGSSPEEGPLLSVSTRTRPSLSSIHALNPIIGKGGFVSFVVIRGVLPFGEGA